MLPNSFDALGELARLTGLLSIVSGAFAWWNPSDPEGDRILSNATDELIEGISDADLVGKIEEDTKNNLRDQTSIEQIEKWRSDQEFRKYPWRS